MTLKLLKIKTNLQVIFFFFKNLENEDVRSKSHCTKLVFGEIKVSKSELEAKPFLPLV